MHLRCGGVLKVDEYDFIILCQERLLIFIIFNYAIIYGLSLFFSLRGLFSRFIITLTHTCVWETKYCFIILFALWITSLIRIVKTQIRVAPILKIFLILFRLLKLRILVNLLFLHLTVLLAILEPIREIKVCLWSFTALNIFLSSILWKSHGLKPLLIEWVLHLYFDGRAYSRLGPIRIRIWWSIFTERILGW